MVLSRRVAARWTRGVRGSGAGRGTDARSGTGSGARRDGNAVKNIAYHGDTTTDERTHA